LSINAFAQQDQIEISPFSNATHSTNSVKDSFNLLFSFPTIAFIGEYGVETDGSDVYVTQWLDDSIAKYDQAGNVLDEFVIPDVGRTRDLAWDGQYYYGSPNEFYFYVLDLDNKVLIDTIPTTFTIRGMAYDPVEDVLWASEHWSPMFYNASAWISWTSKAIFLIPGCLQELPWMPSPDWLLIIFHPADHFSGGSARTAPAR